jgi:hypothetical protein
MKALARSASARRAAIAVAVIAGLGTWLGLRRTDAQSTPAPAAAPEGAAPVAGETTEQAAPPTGNTATVSFRTSPSVPATVSWGNTALGRIAPGESLVVVRPRDSGPLDVVVRANGYLPVHTRAHTFSNHEMLVKLTTPEKQYTLLGYRAPIDAGVPEAATDAAVPSSLFYAPPGAAAQPAAGGAAAPPEQ